MDERAQPQPGGGGGASRFIMMFMIMMTLFIILDPNMRSALGGAMTLVMNPLIGFNGAFPLLTLLFAGMITSSISILGRHFFVDWVEMARSQKIMSAFNKERREAMMSRNMAKLERLNKMSPEIMQKATRQSMNQLKPMAFTMIIIIVIFSWLYSFISSYAVDPKFSVPWDLNSSLNAVTVLPHWVMVYALISIPFGQVITRLLKYFSFKKKLREKGVLE
jgi:uncharacterized membrane protein (DUF106 family)